MASANAAESAGPARPAASLKSILVEFVIVAVIAGAIGASFAILRPAQPPRIAEASEKPPAPPPVSNVIDLPPIVTNLATPSDTWIRMELSIIFDGKSLPHPEVEAAQIGADALAYLRTLTLSQIEGPIGLQNIRQDLNERALIRSADKVKELVIRTMVVQ
jgi:flagellar FliL protein